MMSERKNTFAREVKSEKSLTGETLKLIGYGCSLCDWKTKTTEYFRALPEFGNHNNQRHPDTFDAHIVHIYQRK